MKKYSRALATLIIAIPWATIQAICNKFLFKKHVRVLIYHHIDTSSYSNFLRQIKFIQKKYDVITPEKFQEFKSGKFKLSKNSILITIDDGFKSGLNLETEIFGERNIKIIYFLVNNFVKCQNYSERIEFIKNKFEIYDATRINELGIIGNLNILDIKKLIDAGHTIGAHTRSHVRLSKVASECDLYSEIVGSSSELSTETNFKVRDFAFTFGDIKSISRDSLALAINNFDFVYTGIRGKNSFSSKLIYRDAIEPSDSLPKLWLILNGGYDIFYYMAKLRLWIMLKK